MSAEIQELSPLPWRYQADFHGHSLFSDGKHSPEMIVLSAVQSGLGAIALTDHDSVAGLDKFLNSDDYHEVFKRRKTPILRIPGVEVTTEKGHLLVLLPIAEKADVFIGQYPQWDARRKADPVQVITESIAQDGICIFPHPATPLVDSFSYADIEATLEEVPEEMHKNIGIEVNNWISAAFFWNRQRNQREILAYNNKWKLAEFAGSDFHKAEHAGKFTTWIPGEVPTGQGILTAVQKRQTKPHGHLTTPQDMWEIAHSGMTKETMQTIRETIFDRGNR